MGICTFFGHRDCPETLLPALRDAVENAILRDGIDTFYVGREGAFDLLAAKVLLEKEFLSVLFMKAARLPLDNPERQGLIDRLYEGVKKHNITEAYQENGTMYYDDASEYLIREGFPEMSASKEAHQTRTESASEAHHEAFVDTLIKQLEAKDKQIAELTALLNQEQQLHLQTQNQLKLLEAPAPVESAVTLQKKKKWRWPWEKG